MLSFEKLLCTNTLLQWYKTHVMWIQSCGNSSLMNTKELTVTNSSLGYFVALVMPWYFLSVVNSLPSNTLTSLDFQEHLAPSGYLKIPTVSIFYLFLLHFDIIPFSDIA